MGFSGTSQANHAQSTNRDYPGLMAAELQRAGSAVVEIDVQRLDLGVQSSGQSCLYSGDLAKSYIYSEKTGQIQECCHVCVFRHVFFSVSVPVSL